MPSELRPKSDYYVRRVTKQSIELKMLILAGFHHQKVVVVRKWVVKNVAPTGYIHAFVEF